MYNFYDGKSTRESLSTVRDKTILRMGSPGSNLCYAKDYKTGVSMSIFRQLRWRLTFSYTLVTVSAFLVILLVMGGIILKRVFIPENILTPEGTIEIIRQSNTPLWSHILSQSPVDRELITLLIQGSRGTITGFDFFTIGDLTLTVKTGTQMRLYVLGPDGILLGISDEYYLPSSEIGKPFLTDQPQGYTSIIRAALAGETDAKKLYTVIKEKDQWVLAIPAFNLAGDTLVGVVVFIMNSIPTRNDIPMNILIIAIRSLLVFLFSAGIMGAVFGSVFIRGLTARLRRLSTATEAWSEGDFSKNIDDTTGDEIGRFAQSLNAMAQQLQGLVNRRKEMAISEERNRLARDLHDSAKQQALAASFQLGTALSLYDRDPQVARQHLVEAEMLVDSVREELTNLVHELRPQSIDGQDFAETLKEYVLDWSHRCGIDLNIHIDDGEELPLENRGSLFRIIQEGLANIARHSHASSVDLSLEYTTSMVTLNVNDNGQGFETHLTHSGLGLKSMRERAEALGGSFTIDSAPEHGTRITVTFPRE
jgi:signal transduction histidine kinase